MKRMIVLLIGLYFSGLTFDQVGGNTVQLDRSANLDARSIFSAIRGTSKWQYISENSEKYSYFIFKTFS